MSDAVAVKKKPLTRFGEFELMKAMAIIGLPTVHLMEEALEAGFGSDGLNGFASAVIGMCAFGPSVFMMCMGFGMGDSHVSHVRIRNNGLQFLVIGAVLNIVRWLIPGIVKNLALNTNFVEDIDLCFQSDIYYFVGIFYIFYSFLKKIKMQTTGLILISLLTLSINTLLTPLTAHIDNEIVSSILGNFVYVDHTSCFPLFSWAIFPSVGILLGEILKKSDEEQRKLNMRRILAVSFVAFFSFVVFLRDYKMDIMKIAVSPANDYITDFPNVVLLVSMALLLVVINYHLCRFIGASRFMAFMLKISTFIIPFYLLQWVIVAWVITLMNVFRAPAGCMNMYWYAFGVVAITAVCIFVTSKFGMKIMKVILKYTNFNKKKKKKKKPVND